MADRLRSILGKIFRSYEGNNCADQLRLARELNSLLHLGFSDNDFPEIPDMLDAKSNRPACIILDMRLESLRMTIWLLWYLAALRDGHAESDFSPKFLSVMCNSNLKQYDDETWNQKLCWKKFSPDGVYNGHSVDDAIDQATKLDKSCGTELLSAMLFCPKIFKGVKRTQFFMCDLAAQSEQPLYFYYPGIYFDGDKYSFSLKCIETKEEDNTAVLIPLSNAI